MVLCRGGGTRARKGRLRASREAFSVDTATHSTELDHRATATPKKKTDAKGYGDHGPVQGTWHTFDVPLGTYCCTHTISPEGTLMCPRVSDPSSPCGCAHCIRS